MVQQDIDYSKWHVANIYFGNTDGFAIFDDEDLGLSFGIAGKYTTQSLTNVIFGFYPAPVTTSPIRGRSFDLQRKAFGKRSIHGDIVFDE